MDMDKNETLNNIIKHLNKLDDNSSKSSLRAIFSEILQKEEDSIIEIKKRVESKITSFIDNKLPVIYQSYLNFNENLPEKYFEIIPNKKEISKQNNTDTYIIETDDYSSKNWTTLTSVLLFDEENLDKLIQKINIQYKNVNIEFKVEKSMRFYQEFTKLKKCFHIRNLNWEAPFSPYFSMVYDVKIKSPNFMIDETNASFDLDNKEPIEIELDLESSTMWCFGARIIWNIENIEQQTPRSQTITESGKKFDKYFLTAKDNDLILPKESIESIVHVGNKYEITIPENNNFNYDYLKIHHLEEYEIYINSKSNKKNRNITQAIQVKSRADIESLFNCYEDINNIKLIDYKLDKESRSNPNNENPYYEINEFDLDKRGILTLNISCKKEDLTSDKIDFICAKIQEKMASYWCISKVEYE